MAPTPKAVSKHIADYLNRHTDTQAVELLRGDGAVVVWIGHLPDVTASAAAAAMWSPESRKDGNRVYGLLRLEGARSLPPPYPSAWEPGRGAQHWPSTTQA